MTRLREGGRKGDRARLRPTLAWAMLLLLSMTAIVCLVTRAIERRRERDRTDRVATQGMQLSLALNEYLSDHHDTFPTASHWEDQLKPYLTGIPGGTVSIVAPPGESPRRFAMNPYVSGRKRDSLEAPAGTVVFFESVAPGPDAADALVSVPAARPGRESYFVVVYSNGWTWVLPADWKKRFPGEGAQRELLGQRP